MRRAMVAAQLSSLIGKKMGMALTGLVLYGFLIGHLAGNTLLFKRDGGQSYNAYSEYLTHHPLLVPTELVLLAAFLLHIYLAIGVSLDNRRARPIGYHVRSRAVGGRTWASSTMLWSGLLILIFVVIHLKTFKFGDPGSGSLYDLVSATFKRTGYLVWYTFSMAILGFHLWHAFQSAFQTLSISSSKISMLGIFFAIFLALGFGLICLFMGLLA